MTLINQMNEFVSLFPNYCNNRCTDVGKLSLPKCVYSRYVRLADP